MAISRDGETVFRGSVGLDAMVRDPAEMIGVLASCYSIPAGAWLLTGTGVVPDPPYTAQAGDEIEIAVEGIGRLRNTVRLVPHRGAGAPPRPGRS